MSGPAIRLVMDEMPAKSTSVAALILAAALTFCAEPETFPVFAAWCADRAARRDMAASVQEILADLNPHVLNGIAGLVTEGVTP